MTFKFLRLLLWISLTVCSLRAQQPASLPPPLQFRICSYELEIVKATAKPSNGKDVPIGISPYLPGGVMQFPANTSSIQLRFKLRGETDPKAPAHTALCVIPAGATMVFAILAEMPPDAEGKRVFQTKVINEDTTVFPSGTVRMINLLNLPVAGRISGETISLAPGEMRNVTPKLDSRYRARGEYAVSNSGNWQIISSEIMLIFPGKRSTVLIVQSPSALAVLNFEREIINPPRSYDFQAVGFSDTPVVLESK